MGLGDLVNELGDSVEHTASGAGQALGKAADVGAHAAGGVLDSAGLHGAAEAVDGFGDTVADDLGAQVAEQRLGQTNDPKQLIHGDVGGLQESVGHLRKFGAAFDETAHGLKGMDTSHWNGDAADAFQQTLGKHVPLWSDAGEACSAAATALDGYAHTVQWAQSQAQEAIALYNQGQQATQQAQAQHAQQLAAYNQAAQSYNQDSAAGRNPGPAPQQPGALSDPGNALRQQAQEMLDRARQQRDSAAQQAQSAINQATDTAPQTPSFSQRMRNDASDALTVAASAGEHVLGGVLKGAGGIVKFAQTLNPANPYNLTHPAEYADSLSNTAAGLVRSANHPAELVKGLVGTGWSKDPAEAFGKLLPNIALSAATDGAGTAASAGEDVAEREALSAGEEAASRDWSNLAQPAPHVSEPAIHADSVDPATAHQFLQDQHPWMADVNAPRYHAGVQGYTQNCTNNVVAVNDRLDGHEVFAAPTAGPGQVDTAALGNPAAQPQVVSSYDDIIRDMQARGEGSRGVVFIARQDDTGHVFNVIHSPNGIEFLDGQTGMLGKLEQHNVRLIGYMPYR